MSQVEHRRRLSDRRGNAVGLNPSFTPLLATVPGGDYNFDIDIDLPAGEIMQGEMGLRPVPPQPVKKPVSLFATDPDGDGFDLSALAAKKTADA